MGYDVIFTDFFKAIAQIPDPRFTRVFWLGIGLTFALLVGTYAAFLWLINILTSGGVEIPGVGTVDWIGDLLGWGSLFLMLFLSIFLMVPVASVITSLFLDDVAQAVEDEHYPGLPPIPRLSWGEQFRDTLNFLGVLIGANVVALFVYAMLPFLMPFIFFSMNGYLLGREYFQIAAMRREGRVRAKELWRANSGQVWVAGCLMALPLSVPLINLAVPILGAATFTHLYHRVASNG